MSITEKKVELTLSEYSEIIKLTTDTLDIGEEFILNGRKKYNDVIQRIRIVDDKIVDTQVIYKSQNRIKLCVLVGNILYFTEKFGDRIYKVDITDKKHNYDYFTGYTDIKALVSMMINSSPSLLIVDSVGLHILNMEDDEIISFKFITTQVKNIKHVQVVNDLILVSTKKRITIYQISGDKIKIKYKYKTNNDHISAVFLIDSTKIIIVESKGELWESRIWVLNDNVFIDFSKDFLTPLIYYKGLLFDAWDNKVTIYDMKGRKLHVLHFVGYVEEGMIRIGDYFYLLGNDIYRFRFSDDLDDSKFKYKEFSLNFYEGANNFILLPRDNKRVILINNYLKSQLQDYINVNLINVITKML